MVGLHANAIPENRPVGVRTRWIHRYDADRLFLFAVLARQMVDQRALPCPRRSRHSDDARVSTVGEQRFHETGSLGGIVFDRGDRRASARTLPERTRSTKVSSAAAGRP